MEMIMKSRYQQSYIKWIHCQKTLPRTHCLSGQEASMSCAPLLARFFLDTLAEAINSKLVVQFMASFMSLDVSIVETFDPQQPRLFVFGDGSVAGRTVCSRQEAERLTALRSASIAHRLSYHSGTTMAAGWHKFTGKSQYPALSKNADNSQFCYGVKTNRTFRLGWIQGKRDLEMEKAVITWIEDVTREFAPADDEVGDWLQSGILICRVLEAVAPGLLVRKINTKKSQFSATENINNFLESAMRAPLALRPEDLFELSDLLEQRDLGRVMCTLNTIRLRESEGHKLFLAEVNLFLQAFTRESLSRSLVPVETQSLTGPCCSTPCSDD
uniref:Calponin-homology (CH) domain-containing protein n=1 Tax=Steinernema glaseri TaxID=37863 RepID=A0A1I7XZW4_9BILA